MNKQFISFSKPVAIWLFTGVGMLIVQIILGGITRLTGSGLSITEWNIVTGTLPPLNTVQWMTEFNKYKQTPQFNLLNADFGLSDFKFIFFWEWAHRFWARLMAVVFLIPFVIFLFQKRFGGEMIRPLIILFLLGALQGIIGWIMVVSGLSGDAVYVRPTKLALHFIFALGLIAYTFWFALKLSVPRNQLIRNQEVYRISQVLIITLFFQLLFGALMAGHKAANAAPTWPAINGEWVPDSIFKLKPALINILENKITIHFIHRSLAYILILISFIWTYKALRSYALSRYFRATRMLPILIILLQVFLGILTVLFSTFIIPNRWRIFEWVAELHQVVGMLFLLIMVWMLYIVRPLKNPI